MQSGWPQAFEQSPNCLSHEANSCMNNLLLCNTESGWQGQPWGRSWTHTIGGSFCCETILPGISTFAGWCLLLPFLSGGTLSKRHRYHFGWTCSLALASLVEYHQVWQMSQGFYQYDVGHKQDNPRSPGLCLRSFIQGRGKRFVCGNVCFGFEGEL